MITDLEYHDALVCLNPHYSLDSLGGQAYNSRIMNRLSQDKRVQIVNALVEGN
jgi:hypothetical protein